MLHNSVDIVPVIESRPCASIPTVITSAVTTIASVDTPPLRRTVNIGGFRSQKGSYSHSGLDRIALDESPPRNRRNIGSNTESQEDLLEERRKNRHNFRQRLKDTDLALRQDVINSNEQEPDEHNETAAHRQGLTGGKERIERVRSLVAPSSFSVPEKLIIQSSDDYLSSSETEKDWLKERFPLGTKLVTVPRGDKGFGFIMVEGNVSVSNYIK